MITRVKNALNPYKNNKIIVSVSGGVDSLTLLDIMIKLNYDIVVVNFNHQQRKESIKEAEYIKKLCENNNIPFELITLNINSSSNFQSAASEARKKHLIATANKYNTNVIVTAHHLDDLAETILLKITRGSNLLGYAGMQQSYYKYNIYFIKPLLHVTKDEIEDYAITNNIKYFTDESNLKDVYTRNKIRHNVIPYLVLDNPAFLNKIIEYNESLTLAFNHIRNNTLKFLNNSLKFNIHDFNNLDKALKVDIISYLLEEYDLVINKDKINDILKFIGSSGPNKSLDIGNNYLLIKSYELIYIEEKRVTSSFNVQLKINEENVLPNGDVIIINNKLDDNVSNQIILCYNKMVQPLYARNRKKGDKLYFSYGHKKLKDYYIDEKVPLKERNNDILIVDSEDNILAVVNRYTNNHKDLKDKLYLVYRRK